jgi:hypothetical protein
MHVTYASDVSPLTERWKVTQGLNGRMTFDLDADFVAHLRVFPFQNDPTNVHILDGVVENNGFANSILAGGTPHVKGLANITYTQGPLTLSWQTRYIGKGALFVRDATATDHSESLDPPFAEPTFYHNVSAHYRLSGGLQGGEIFGGVNNLFGEEPPFTTIATGQDIAYDLGRFFFLGFRYRR